MKNKRTVKLGAWILILTLFLTTSYIPVRADVFQAEESREDAAPEEEVVRQEDDLPEETAATEADAIPEAEVPGEDFIQEETAVTAEEDAPEVPELPDEDVVSEEPELPDEEIAPEETELPDEEIAPEGADAAAEHISREEEDAPNEELATAADPSAAAAPDQWYLDVIHAREAWELSLGRDVVIAVVDTGVDAEHPDLKAGLLEPESTYTSSKGIMGTADLAGHGTMVTGVLVADGSGTGIKGIVPEAKVLSIRTGGNYEDDPSLSLSAVVRAVVRAVEMKVDVINMSLGMPADQVDPGSKYVKALRAAVKQAEQAGIPVICAAGNDGVEELFFPASEDATIAVGGAAVSAGAYDRWKWSNYGEGLDLAAPSKKITSTRMGGGTETRNGTSIAAPMVTGAVASLISLDKAKNGGSKTLDPAEIRELLHSTAADLGQEGYDPYTGYGMLNIKALLERYLEGAGEQTVPEDTQQDDSAETIDIEEILKEIEGTEQDEQLLRIPGREEPEEEGTAREDGSAPVPAVSDIYTIVRTEGEPSWDEIPVLRIDRMLWTENTDVKAWGQLCYDDSGLYVRMWANEKDIIAECTEPSQTLEEDSCLAFLFKPENGKDYFSFEVNPNGCLRVQTGSEGADAAEREELAVDDPAAYFGIRTDRTEEGWEVSYRIPVEFIRKIYPEYEFGGLLKANLYKLCGKTASRHYLAWAPIETESPDLYRTDFLGAMRFE